MTDEEFFKQYPDRHARIRLPTKTLVRTPQRAVHYADECEGEFWSLGQHDRKRRRIILWRVPEGNPWYDPVKQPLLKIPFLAFADETIEDTDEVLLPLIHEVMTNARAQI